MADDDGQDAGGFLGILLTLLLIGVVIPLLLFVNVYVMVKWQHPEDASQWVFPKVVVVGGATIVELIVLGLPLDVANGSGLIDCAYDFGDDTTCPRLDMLTYWYCLFLLAAIWALVLVPTCVLAYEDAEDEDVGALTASGSSANAPQRTRAASWRAAMRGEATVILFFGLVFGCMFGLLNEFRVPYDEARGDALNATARAFGVSENGSLTSSNGGILATMGPVTDDELRWGASVDDGSERTAKMPTTFFVYLTALMSFLGFFFFALWGGIGLAALPIDLCMSYFLRPVPLSGTEIAEFKLQLQSRAAELVDVGKSLKTERREYYGAATPGWWAARKRDAGDRVKLNKLKQMVYLLETDVQDYALLSTNRDKYDPLVYVANLALGIVAAGHSVLWLLQIILYVLVDPPVSSFMNAYLLQFDTWFPVFGVVAFLAFAAYLQLAVMKGCFKFGMRCFLIDLHPMQYNATYMNAFLFNTALFLVCSFPVAYLLTTAFNEYAQYTDIATIFRGVIRYLRAFSVFFDEKVFEYAIVGVAGVSAVYLLLSPRDEPASAAKLKASLGRYQDFSTGGESRYATHNVL